MGAIKNIEIEKGMFLDILIKEEETLVKELENVLEDKDKYLLHRFVYIRELIEKNRA